MTTVLETKTTQAVPAVLSAMQDLPLRNIHESKTNPRRQFDETKLAELADNIRLHGVLQPVLVRPLPGGEAGQYELVAGARRYRASQLAKRETIPATIRELTDTQCLELQLIENLQRADVHELDEARGYAALMQLQPETYTVETLAEKIGRSEKYVYARLRLLQLVDEVQQAFYTGKLIERGFASWASCTANHPTNYPGISFWADTISALRELLHLDGWTRRDDGNLPLTVDAKGRVSIVVRYSFFQDIALPWRH